MDKFIKVKQKGVEKLSYIKTNAVDHVTKAWRYDTPKPKRWLSCSKIK
jgi:hypothetical protein